MSKSARLNGDDSIATYIVCFLVLNSNKTLFHCYSWTDIYLSLQFFSKDSLIGVLKGFRPAVLQIN